MAALGFIAVRFSCDELINSIGLHPTLPSPILPAWSRKADNGDEPKAVTQWAALRPGGWEVGLTLSRKAGSKSVQSTPRAVKQWAAWLRGGWVRKESRGLALAL